MKSKELPPFEVVNYFMKYDPQNGIVTWRFTATKGIKEGKVVGYVTPQGYCKTRFFRTIYCLHRICWLLYYKEDPRDMVIDHIDGNKLNNKIDNLRLATKQQNRLNAKTRSDNKLGVPGVRWSKQRKCYIVKVCINGKSRSKNCHSLDDAVIARNNMAREMHGEFAKITN